MGVNPRVYQLGLWLAIFFAIFLRLPPNKFLRIPPDISPVSIRLALLFLLLLRIPVPRIFNVKSCAPRKGAACQGCARACRAKASWGRPLPEKGGRGVSLQFVFATI